MLWKNYGNKPISPWFLLLFQEDAWMVNKLLIWYTLKFDYDVFVHKILLVYSKEILNLNILLCRYTKLVVLWWIGLYGTLPYCDVLPIELNNKIKYNHFFLSQNCYTALNSLSLLVRVRITDVLVISSNLTGAFKIWTFPNIFTTHFVVKYCYIRKF